MDKKVIWLIIALIIILLIIMGTSKKLKAMVANFKQRGSESGGSGKFGAPRKRSDGTTYFHQGIDVLTPVNAPIYAPFDVEYIQVARPYANDSVLSGGDYKSENLVMRIFYMKPITNKKSFKQGEIIGYAQNVAGKYGEGVSNHIHIEIRENGKLINPETMI